MPNRGTALQYKIRKTTINNATGDNYSITIPRVIAQRFEECLFRLAISGNCIIFESGCKMTVNDIEINKAKRVIIGGVPIILK